MDEYLIVHMVPQPDADYQEWFYMCPDVGKLTKVSHLVFKEIPIVNIQANAVPLC